MKSFLAGIANAGREILGLKAGPPDASELSRMCGELLKLKSEAAAIALADTLLDAYRNLESEQRRAFFHILLDELEPDRERVAAAVAAWQQTPDPATLLDLNRATESARRALISALNMAPGATEALVRMRADLLDVMEQDPALTSVDDDFVYVFQSWFNRGFLSLAKIDWQTPAFILEKLIAHEAVHEIRGWDDLRRRLADDRRCFAFFHPALPDEPLIFVQIALVAGLASNIENLLAPDASATETPDTAVFYSISNCQRGLTGISFGNFLIKQVADMLAAELPSLKTYATLSPVPGFGRWLEEALGEHPEELPLLDGERDKLAILQAPRWRLDRVAADVLRPLLMKLCAHYLLRVKRGREPRDAVARFHLRNGARLERLNWLADPSPNGMRHSFGLMVNYVYDRRAVLGNHEAFVNRGQIAVSAAVRKLAG